MSAPGAGGPATPAGSPVRRHRAAERSGRAGAGRRPGPEHEPRWALAGAHAAQPPRGRRRARLASRRRAAVRPGRVPSAARPGLRGQRGRLGDLCSRCSGNSLVRGQRKAQKETCARVPCPSERLGKLRRRARTRRRRRHSAAAPRSRKRKALGRPPGSRRAPGAGAGRRQPPRGAPSPSPARPAAASAPARPRPGPCGPPAPAPLTREAAALAVAAAPLQHEEGVGSLRHPQRVGHQHLLRPQPHRAPLPRRPARRKRRRRRRAERAGAGPAPPGGRAHRADADSGPARPLSAPLPPRRVPRCAPLAAPRAPPHPPPGPPPRVLHARRSVRRRRTQAMSSSGRGPPAIMAESTYPRDWLSREEGPRVA